MKWANIFQRHCSDELLLAYVDRELTLRKERKVKNHLGVCWSCRARLGELDHEAQNFARAFSEQTFPGPRQVARARDAIFDRVRLFEQEQSLAPALPLLGHPRRSMALWAAAAAVLIAGIFIFRPSGPELILPPETVLARAQETEAQLYQEPLHQTFRVDVIQEKPQTEQRASSLEVWFDNSQGRFASRWKETDGSLKYGLWRPDQGQEYIYDPLSEKHPDRAVSLFELSEVDLELLETGFMRWLERRRWRPISFVSELARFAGEDGIILRVRLVQGQNGKDAYQLSARRQVGGTTVEIAVEVDGETFRPRMQRVRIETPDRVVALSLMPEQIESIPASSLLPAVFEPDLPLKAVERRLSERQTQQAPVSSLPNGDLAAKFPTPAELDATEMEAHYALHLAGACLGEPIEIVREARGRLIVRGVARSAARQSELLAALGELQGPPWLHLEIQTVESAIAASREAGQQPATASGTVSPAGGSPAAAYAVHVSSDRLALQDQLERYFTREGDRSGASTNLNAFTRQAVSQSQTAMDHAWALRRLAERYGSAQTEQSLPRSRWLLQVMVREHLAEFTKQARMTRELLQPVLASIAGSLQGSRRDGKQGVASAGPALDGDWKDAVLRAFASIEELHRSVLGLFAGASLPVDEDAGQSRVRVKTAEEVVNSVLDSLPRLESEIASAQDQMARDFSNGRSVVAGKDAGR